MTAEIICYKATFHAIAQKFELMHTGWILIFKISFSNHSILGHISKKEIDRAESLQTRLTVNEQRIRLYIIEGRDLKMLVEC